MCLMKNWHQTYFTTVSLEPRIWKQNKTLEAQRYSSSLMKKMDSIKESWWVKWKYIVRVDLQSARVKLKHLLGKCYISIIITEYQLYLSFFNFSESIKLFVLLIFGGIDDHITV